MYEYEKFCWDYVFKAKKTTSVKAIIEYLTENNHLGEEDSIYILSELTVPLKMWEKARKV